jgi:hypothetical protein
MRSGNKRKGSDLNYKSKMKAAWKNRSSRTAGM